MYPSLKLALGEFRDHKGVYAAIIIIVALSMTIFTTQSAMNEYNDYTTTRSVGMFYGDGVVTRGGTTVRNIISGALPMTDARETVDKINAIPGFKASPRAEGEGAVTIDGVDDVITSWGIDIKTDELVCNVRGNIITGQYFDKSKTYTQSGMGNPFGSTVLLSPSFVGSLGPISISNNTRNNNTIYPYPILIGRTCAEIHHLKLGSIFTGSVLTEAAALYCDARFVVIGIFETEKPMIETIFYITPIESIQEAKGWNGDTANFICVNTPDEMSDDEVRQALAPIIGDKVFYSKGDIKNALEGNLNAISKVILNTTIGASLLLSVAAIKFVMDSIIIRKSREIGTLKALGARDRMVVGIFVYQAIFIGIIAGGLGLLAATALMNGLSAYGFTLQYSLGAQMKIKFILTPAIAITALSVPVIVSLIASILPCMQAARLSPVEAIRYGELQGVKEYKESRFRLSMPYLRRSLSPFSLAINEMKDHMAIYVAVMLVISVALSVFALQASYQQNLKETITHNLKDSLCSDGIVLAEKSTQRSLFGGAPKITNAKGLAENISAATGYTTVVRSNHQCVLVIGGIDSSSTVYEGASVWGIDKKNDEAVFQLKKTLIKGNYFDENLDYTQKEYAALFQYIPGVRVGGISTTEINEFAQTAYPVIVGDTCAKAHNFDIGSQFSVMMMNSEKGGTGIVSAPFEVVGIYDTGFALTDSLMYYTPIEVVNEMMGYDDTDGNAVIVKTQGDVDYRDIYSALSSAAPGYTSYSWHEAVIYIVGPAFDALLLIIYAAIAITLVLAAVIIKYAMDSAVDRKTREIGTLKAFGARDRTIIEMFLYQGVVIGGLSGILATLLSMALAYLIINVVHLNTQMPMGLIMKVGFTVTWFVVAVTMITPLITSIAAASMPSKRAAALSPVEAIRKGELNN
jgi:ABC-type lipoprotein release transport system permease subunit